jgi:hypothetical protein
LNARKEGEAAFKDGATRLANTQMDFDKAAVALLASMVLVLAGMVGWLYWQQQRLFQNMNGIVSVVGELASRPATIMFPQAEPEPEAEAPAPAEEDDRVSVDETSPDVPVVDGPPAEALDTDGLESKSKKELQEILTKRGLPFNRSDTKIALISLLKATA